MSHTSLLQEIEKLDSVVALRVAEMCKRAPSGTSGANSGSRRRRTLAWLKGLGTRWFLLLGLLSCCVLSCGEQPTTYLAQRVIDGDTIVLETGERVRYIGIDTPETKHPRKPIERMGKEASAFNRRMVQGRRVRLEMDVQERDRYGRLLAYVFVGDVHVNAALVEAGYARVMTVPPNVRHVKLFRGLEQAAREEGRGLWAWNGQD